MIIPINIVANRKNTSTKAKLAGNIGENEVTTLSFTFSNDWEGTTKTIVFKTPAGELKLPSSLESDDTYPVDGTLFDAVGTLYYTVYGSYGDGRVINASGEILVGEALSNTGELTITEFTDIIGECITAKLSTEQATTDALAATLAANGAAALCAETEESVQAAEEQRKIDETTRAGFYAGFNEKLMSKVENEPNYYRVGFNQPYQTISAAVAAWTADGKPASIILISKGTYKEKINLGGMYSALSFVGESKETVMWKQSTGYYPDCPLSISGDVLIKNITFIADITDNPFYSYVPYTSGNTGAAYALHLDAPNAPGIVTVENCDLFSYVNAAIGCGTCKDRTLKIINCNIYSLGNVAETLANGSMLYHGDSIAGTTGQKIVLRNNYFYNAYSALALYLQNIGNTAVNIEMVGNTLDSGVYTTNTALVTTNFETASGFLVSKSSCGNNVERMNYADSSWQKAKLTDRDGYAIMNAVDFNLVFAGVFKGSSVLGTLNSPVAGHAFLGFCASYSAPYYHVQYAWDCDAAMKMYRRYWLTASWTAWVPCSETDAGIQAVIQSMLSVSLSGYTRSLTGSDANAADKTGYYTASVNTPTSATYFIHHIGLSATLAVQEAWLAADGAKFKRVKNTTWSNWVSA